MNIAPNTHNLQKRVDYALANLHQNARDLCDRMSWHWTEVVMSKRLRRAAGRCTYWRLKDTFKIEFSQSLFDSFPEMEKTDTVIHELAHAVCFRLNMERGHGADFKSVCRAMGGTGERCVRAEVGTVKCNLVKRWVMVRTGSPDKLHIRTRKQSENFKCVYRDAVLLGVIQVDKNSKRLKWLSSVTPEVATVNPLQGKYELVA
jgi:predicted SprT family Zn-dependent metalloprotease